MNKKIDETHYYQIVDSFIETLRKRKSHLWEISANYEDCDFELELIHNEMERIDKVIKLYKNNKF